MASTGVVTATASTITSASTTTSTATSLAVKIGNAPGTPNDWVGLFNTAGAMIQWQHLNGSHDAPAVGLTSAALSFKLPPTPFFYFDIPASWLTAISAALVPPLTLTAYTPKLFNGTNALVGASATATATLACAGSTTSSPLSSTRLKSVTQCLRASQSFQDLSRCLCQ